MEYKIGQILTLKRDLEVEKIFGEKVIIPKGSRIIIGADKFAHYLRDGMIQPLQEDAEVKGYDTEGITEYLFLHLRTHFPIEEMLEDYDSSEKSFKEVLECALDEIGL